MLNELNTLESKISQVVALCHSLRTENDGLREQHEASEAEEERIDESIAAARSRIEQLAELLPEFKA